MLSALIVAMLAGASYVHPEQLVDTDWVAAHSADANVRVVDMRRGGCEAGHVPGAVYLQPEAIRDAKKYGHSNVALVNGGWIKWTLRAVIDSCLLGLFARS